MRARNAMLLGCLWWLRLCLSAHSTDSSLLPRLVHDSGQAPSAISCVDRRVLNRRAAFDGRNQGPYYGKRRFLEDASDATAAKETRDWPGE